MAGRLLAAAMLLAAPLVGLGCGGSDAAGPGGPAEPSEPGFSLAVSVSSVTVARGRSTQVRVDIRRHGGFAGAVAVASKGAPASVTVTSATAEPGDGSVLLGIVAEASSRAGSTMVTVEGSATGQAPASGAFSLRVAPPPVPFAGTIFIDPDIITEDDPTTLESVVHTGRGDRQVFDRRVDGWIMMSALLFDVTFTDGLTTEAQVNPEFSLAAAEVVVQRYAEAVGRLPWALRRDVDALWIHRGVQPFGGGNRSILFHTGQGDLYERDGILEETLVHEAAHTSLDADWAASAGWLQAQRDDGTFISTYAEDFPTREDVAETLVPYLAVRYRADRIPAAMADAIKLAIPFRIAFLDSLGLDLSLLEGN